jgi:hypothetical protein
MWGDEMSRELLQRVLKVLKVKRLRLDEHLIPIILEEIEAELAKPEQAVVPFPSFMRRRIEEAIDSAINPKGMSVHDGKATVYASDLQRMLLVVDLAAQQLAKPEQEPIGWFLKDHLETYMESYKDIEGAIPLYTAPPRKEWVGLTDAHLMKEFGYSDELLRNTAYRVAKILEERNT